MSENTEESERGIGWRPTTIAEKIERLFEVMHPAGEKPMSSHKIVALIREKGGSLSVSYLSDLRNGKKLNVGMEHLNSLADAFGIRPGYFNDPEVAEEVDRQLDLLLARRDRRVTALAERTASLDDTHRAALLDLVDSYLRERAQRSASGSDEDPPQGHASS